MLDQTEGQSKDSHLEESHGRAVSYGPILDFRLLGQVVGRVDGRVHPLHREESS